MDVDVVLLSGLDTFGSVLERVGANDWGLPSPCAGWNARALTGHVLLVLQSAATIMRGGTFDWAAAGDPSTVAGEDPVAVFGAGSADVRAALPKADLDLLMDTPMGPMSLGKRLAFPAMDLHLHAWDLGRTISVAVEIPQEVATFTRAALEHVPAEMMRSDGVFGPEVLAPANATTTEALVAWTGRQPR